MIKLVNVCREFRVGTSIVQALKNVSLELPAGQITAVVGPSGGGKSTLLNLIGHLLRPTSGTITIDGKYAPRGARNAARFRNETFGYLAQDFALIESDTVFDNVRVPLIYSTKRRRVPQRQAVAAALDKFGIGDLINHPVRLLSGGQRQRVALARAIINSAQIILADEPTGALDQENSALVFEHLRALATAGHTVLLVTHDLDLADLCDTIYELRDGAMTGPTIRR